MRGLHHGAVTPPSETSPEALLAHATWMRALALGLVSDPHEADDVVQDAALAALLHSPPAGEELRPWLATVMRRLVWRRWRAAMCRADHEADAGRPGDDEADALERIDTQRLLLEAVRGLEEPLRTTVVQRYFEGRTSADIARASGVPAGTVRARLKRALDRLRERLDRETGSRSSWMALVAPLIPREPMSVAAGKGTVAASLLARGVVTMSLVKTALSIAVPVLAALALWTLLRSTPTNDLARIEPAPSVAASDLEVSLAGGPAEHPSRSSAISPEQAEPRSTAATSAEESVSRAGFIDARFLDEFGSPWPDVELLVYLHAQRPRVVAQGLSDRSGFVSVTVELSRFSVQSDGNAAARHELLAQRPGRASHRMGAVIREGDVTHLGDIVLGEGMRVSGRVINERGAAVSDAQVGAVAAGALEGLSAQDLDRIARVGSDAFDFLLAVPSRTDGSFDLTGVTPECSHLWAHAPGLRFGLSEPFEVPPDRSAEGVEITLADFRTEDRISGQVVDPTGAGRRAFLGRTVRAGEQSWHDAITTDDQGRFSFEVEYLDSTYDLDAEDSLREFARVQVLGVRPGDRNVVIAFRRGPPLLLHLRDGQDAPVLDAEIWIGIGGMYSRTPAESPAPGDYVIERPSGTFTLESKAPGFRELHAGRFDQTAPPELDLVLERALAVQGVVLADGAPLPDAIVEVFKYDPDARMTVNGLRCPISYFESGGARTDADGRFELAADVDGSFVVRARHADWVDAEFGPLLTDEVEAEFELELSSGGTIEGFVRVPQGEPAGGRVVAIHRGDGRPRCTRTAENGFYSFEGLMPGDWRVFLLEEELDPHGGSFSSYDGDEPLVWDCRVEIGHTTRYDLDLTQD